MNEVELLKELYTLNETELFYRDYQEKRKDPAAFGRWLKQLDITDCLEKHLIIPELSETMPPEMRDEFFYSDSDAGMIIQKHNCYSPDFEHFHTYFEAFYVYEGTCEHETGGEKRNLKMGDFYIIPPGVSHRISVQNQSIVIVMILSTQIVENTFRNPLYYRDNILSRFFLKNLHYTGNDDSLLFHTGDDAEMKNILIQMMLESINRYAEYDTILSAYFSLFFGKLIRYYEKAANLPSESRRTSQAYELTAYINEHHTDLTLPQLAERYHYTPEYTSRFIKETTGRTFSDLLIDARMKHAVSLLKSTNLSVSEIAYQVGYVNAESFIRVFRRRYQNTPSGYRKSQSRNIVL